MRVALVNPLWSFEHSIYFGCREPHLPLELGYTKALLESDGHDVLMIDGHLDRLATPSLIDQVAAFSPEMTVVTTAPSYLFWRCPPPELRVPRELIAELKGRGGAVVAVGPHGSATPEAALRKLGANFVVRGECEEVVRALANSGLSTKIPSTAGWTEGGTVWVSGGTHAGSFVDLAPLHWPEGWLQRHSHHHHRFEAAPDAPGAEVEASRGCPYSCSFCAKLDFRDRYRRRRLELLLEEIDELIRRGVVYLYFIDEIFLPQRALLEALAERDVNFGVQTRLDLWKPEMIDLLGAGGCVSIEAGVESLTVEGRESLDKNCRLTTEELTASLVYARRRVPFVQANLIATTNDDPAAIAEWRERLRRHDVWANDPVPLYPYPSSPDYRRLWGEPDEHAWERAHEHYLAQFGAFSDIQDERPLPLRKLEASCLSL